jgi:hypothetical protein
MKKWPFIWTRRGPEFVLLKRTWTTGNSETGKVEVRVQLTLYPLLPLILFWLVILAIVLKVTL